MRKYPQPSDYQNAIQLPRHVFDEPELKTCTVRVNPLGIPAVSSGGFALSFYVDAPSTKRYVVRCFKADSPDRQARYAAISKFLNTTSKSFLLDVDYIEKGILIDGEWYPIVKMPYVDGVTFQRYIEGEINVKRSIADLPDKFSRIVAELETVGAAHGDLQHGNIMVERGKIVLVDYDGMYVPALKGRPGEEKGHEHYQHPARESQFGPDLDRFSAMVIYIALRGLVFAPDLWAKYSTGENVLFRRSDLERPDQSDLLRDLERIPALRSLVPIFRSICKGSWDSVPRLAEFIAGRTVPVQVSSNWPATAPKQERTVFDALQPKVLLQHIGEEVTVVGQLLSFRQNQTFRGDPYVFLNFGNHLAGDLTVVIWSEALEKFDQQKRQPRDFVKQWVKVNGTLTTYTPSGASARQPQIGIEKPAQIEVLRGGESEARTLLGLAAQQPIPARQPSRSIDDEISKLYSFRAQPVAPSAPSSASIPRRPVSQPSTPAAKAPSLATVGISVSPAAMQFGQISSEGRQTRTITIANGSALALNIQIEGVKPFLTASPPLVVCRPREIIAIEVRLDPTQLPASCLEPLGRSGGQDAWVSLKNVVLSLKCGASVEHMKVTATLPAALANIQNVSRVQSQGSSLQSNIAAPNASTQSPQVIPAIQLSPAPSRLASPVPKLATPIPTQRATPMPPGPTAHTPPQPVPNLSAPQLAVPPTTQQGTTTVKPNVQAPPQPTAQIVMTSPAQQGTPLAATVTAQGSSQPASQAAVQSTAQAAANPVDSIHGSKLARRSWSLLATGFCLVVVLWYTGFGTTLAKWVPSGADTTARVLRSSAGASSYATASFTPASPVHVSDDSAAGLGVVVSSAAVCPKNLEVDLFQPKDFIVSNTTQFGWRTKTAPPEMCEFQIKLWRDGQTPIHIDASNAGSNPNGEYELSVSLPDVLTPSEQSAGTFSWTIELTLADSSEQSLATKAEPSTFYWLPEKN